MVAVVRFEGKGRLFDGRVVQWCDRRAACHIYTPWENSRQLPRSDAREKENALIWGRGVSYCDAPHGINLWERAAAGLAVVPEPVEHQPDTETEQKLVAHVSSSSSGGELSPRPAGQGRRATPHVMRLVSSGQARCAAA